MDAMTQLIAASMALVGSHFALSHPLRAPIVAKIGEGAFRGLYTIVALTTLGWTICAYRAVPADVVYAASDAAWMIATLLMWIASVLLIGSLVGNPALPVPGARKAAGQDPRGVYAITRHPMMWSFALWATVHAVIAPSVRNHVLMLAIVFLALVGAMMQDRKKARLMGDAWKTWRARTAYFPFGAQLTGRLAWRAAVPSVAVLIVGTLVWLGVTWLHARAGAPAAGIWRWI